MLAGNPGGFLLVPLRSAYMAMFATTDRRRGTPWVRPIRTRPSAHPSLLLAP
jgi:hypothetical protein